MALLQDDSGPPDPSGGSEDRPLRWVLKRPSWRPRRPRLHFPVDPRSKLPPALARWRRLESLELPVPRFRIDSNYVGTPPTIEVTLENLNDNVDRNFLERLVRKFGNMEELEIYYHPVRRKHLGLARIVFEDVKSARLCVKELHGKSVMGKQLNCYIDPFFASAKKMFDELTTERDSRSETTLTLSPIQINHQANSYNHAPNTDPRESNQRRKDSGG
ncbi:Uncharacterized protein FKW44_021861 [Caligus rogercresseyi]|uniref:RRM domain-containing protein n=1 Tax=Caligus rogercresseyi TaxID=217165 RepID=A0A7T8GSB4_CALRO|nr:Uncharacterized protein FKW44_021861 [Caligus rogercresseyi]